MPQLDISVYSSQIFWLIISFLLMFVLMSKLIVPKMSDILGQRQRKIDDNISSAMSFKLSAEEVLGKYEALLEKAEQKADEAIKNTEELLEKSFAKKQYELEQRLAEDALKNQQKIDDLKNEMRLYASSMSDDLSDVVLHKLGLSDAKERDI